MYLYSVHYCRGSGSCRIRSFLAWSVPVSQCWAFWHKIGIIFCIFILWSVTTSLRNQITGVRYCTMCIPVLLWCCECFFRKLVNCLSYCNVSTIRSFTYLFVLRPFFLPRFFFWNWTLFHLPLHILYIPLRWEKPGLKPELLNRGIFWIFSLYLTLLHLPPVRFHCVGGCWDRTQDCCDFGIGRPTPLITRLDIICHSAGSHPELLHPTHKRQAL